MFLLCIFLFLYSCSLVFFGGRIPHPSFSCTSFFYQYIPLSFPIKKIKKNMNHQSISMIGIVDWLSLQ